MWRGAREGLRQIWAVPDAQRWKRTPRVVRALLGAAGAAFGAGLAWQLHGPPVVIEVLATWGALIGWFLLRREVLGLLIAVIAAYEQWLGGLWVWFRLLRK